MPLELYKKKRNFKNTREPKGLRSKGEAKLAFVVQRHNASHLHYDFRLEMDGVLKSWAVPKGPSMNPGDKRLAVMVEDHPYSYKDFEGIIPKGNYGAGTVEIWDKGFYTDVNNSDKRTAEKELLAGIKAGSIKFTLHGAKLKGEFALVEMKNRGKNAWLLIKHKDGYAVTDGYNSENYASGSKAKDKKNAVKTDRTKMLPIEEGKVASFIRPMLAKEIDKPFDDKEWIYEIKWDGYRAMAKIDGAKVNLYSRNGNKFNSAYPIVIQELSKLDIHAILDGEIVVTNSDGVPDFQLLQYYKTDGKHPIFYFVFDLISLNGKDTCELTLLERKELLRKLLPKNSIIKYQDHIKERGKEFFAEIKKRDWEGIMAKKASSQYYPGRRTNDWLKIKQHKTIEALIAGFTNPRGSRKHFGALILAVKNGKSYNYIGHVGTGFDEKKLKEITNLLKPYISQNSPFEERVATNMPVTWVEPKLVCEIKFSAKTKDGILRHPVFMHLRPDKSAREVVGENINKQNTVKVKKEEQHNSYTFGKIEVPVTHASKLFWPKEGITKGDVIAYYQSVADVIIPYLKDRPQSLRRNPNGIADAGFFHKDAGGDAPDWVKTKKIYSESAKKEIEYIICNNKATLCYLNNLGCIELNTWHSTINKLDKPNYLIIDIDPSDKNSFNQVIEAALVIHEIFEKIKAPNYCKTSGATGMHIYVPVNMQYTYDRLKDFSRLICMLANEQIPEFTTLERNLQKRGNNFIYLDYLQNRRGQTIASPYSLRPYAGATVSTPLNWKEVKNGLNPADFNIHTIKKRLQKTGDIFSGILGKGIDLSKCLKLLDK